MDIAKIAKNLQLSEEGIWISRSGTASAFSKEEHDCCFQIEEQSFWFKHRNNCLIEVVKNFPPDGPLFDVGAGNGYVALGLKQSGFETVVVEPGIEGARNDGSRGLSPVICSSVEDAGFEPGTLPAVGMFDVIEHIENDIDLLTRMKSYLTKRGRLYLTVPAYNGIWSVEDDIAGHYRRYTLKRLAGDLKKIGYE